MKRTLENRKCVAFGCIVSEKTHPDIKLFQFPKGKKNIERYRQWVDFSENITLDRDKPAVVFLCAQHFTLDQFKDDAETQLINGALPTVPAIRIAPPKASPNLLLSKHNIPYSVTEVDYEPMCAVALQQSNDSEKDKTDHSYSSPPDAAVVVLPLSSCVQPQPITDETGHIPSTNLPNGDLAPPPQNGENETVLFDNNVPIYRQYHVIGQTVGQEYGRSSAILSKVSPTQGQPFQKKRILTIYSKEKFFDLKKQSNELTEEDIRKLDSRPMKSLKPLSETMPLSSLIFLASQMRCSKRKPQGRRWLEDEKQMALSMYKDSPRSYSLLRAIFSLPHKRTLANMKRTENNESVSIFDQSTENKEVWSG